MAVIFIIDGVFLMCTLAGVFVTTRIVFSTTLQRYFAEMNQFSYIRIFTGMIALSLFCGWLASTSLLAIERQIVLCIEPIEQCLPVHSKMLGLFFLMSSGLVGAMAVQAYRWRRADKMSD